MTYEAILQRMLDNIPNNIDKREGSLIYSALAPAAAEMAQIYADLEVNYNLSFADTATGEYLTRIAAEFGVNRKEATKAQRRGEFYNSSGTPINIPIGSRFSNGNLNYIAVSQISTGVYALECETAGVIGNQLFGQLLPITFIAGLATAQITDVLVPGAEEESDEFLRQRYYNTVNEPAFGGNIADYKQKINAIDGVGGTKVFPVWNGGGTVKCTIIGADFMEPSSILVDAVQEIIDPSENSGQGIGLSPIGHQVTIAGVQEVSIDIETTVTLAAGYTLGQVEESILEVIENYFDELRHSWANQNQIIVRTAQIDARVLTVPGVDDITDTELNGSSVNVVLGADEIPVVGAVVINE